MIDAIYNEDCLEGMKRIPDGSVDMILSDLPYGATACKWDSIIPLEPLWAQYKRVMKKSAVVVLTASQPFTTAAITASLIPLKESLVWEKDLATGHLNANRAHMRAHEDILVFRAVAGTYQPQKLVGCKPMNASTRKGNGSCYGKTANLSYGGATDRFPRSILRFNTVNNSGKIHPTQKPVALFEYLIRTYTNEGETVLDSCMGSGTTAIACLNTGRHYIGFEKDPHYFDVCQKRIEAHKQSAAVASSVAAPNYGLFSQSWSASGAE